MIAVLISFDGDRALHRGPVWLRFGVGGAGDVHDVLAVLGVFYILDKEITLLVVTALLTLAGYSLDGHGGRVRSDPRESSHAPAGKTKKRSSIRPSTRF